MLAAIGDVMHAVARIFDGPAPVPEAHGSAPARERSFLPPVRRRVRASYDAAQTTDNNERHWVWTDALSADQANSYGVRKTTRERARYEYANNPYARGMVQTVANHVIGTGPRLQMLSGDPERDKEIEREWRRWAKRVRLARKLHTMRKARAVDGEAFAIMQTNEKLKGLIKFDLRLIECDRVTNFGASTSDPLNVDGVTLDEFGNVDHYSILTKHPGGLFSSTLGLDAKDVDAEEVIHWYGDDRPEQHRGVTEMMSSLSLYGQMRRYTYAVMDAAETAACYAGVLETDLPPNGEADDGLAVMDPFEIERNMLVAVPAGWKLKQVEAKQPPTGFRDFRREIINEIGRAMNMPYNIAACDSSEYNYASGRLDHQTYWAAVFVDRTHCEDDVLDVIFYTWLAEARLAFRWDIDLEPNHGWFWDGMEHVDPSKEAKAAETLRKNKLQTDAEYFASRGLDWEEQYEQFAKEKKRRVTLGIDAPLEGQPATAAEAVSAALEDPLAEWMEEAIGAIRK